MKWVTHQAAAVTAALALDLPPAGVLAAWGGAVLPDVLDQRLSGLVLTPRGRQRAFNRIHRGATHWFGWWIVLFAGAMAAHISPPLQVMLAGLGFGGLSHVFLDMCTPRGVPLRPFSRAGRFSLNLCSTGGLGEYCFLACVVAAALFFLREDALCMALRLTRYGLF
ncbi:MAG: metal-dependent hydrolase [Desulfovibrio sp.]|nr:metal-dependent hydrolase [Desulfovibrio sp.]